MYPVAGDGKSVPNTRAPFPTIGARDLAMIENVIFERCWALDVVIIADVGIWRCLRELREAHFGER